MPVNLMSAIFIDFDNVYLSLNHSISPRAAHGFGVSPLGWLPDLGAFISKIDGSPRKFLVRRCYINPQSFSRYRPYFVRAGFEVVDCPSLTSQNKNSADIYCVMDILDTLKDYPHVQEYIILSADADFTPVVTRLRKHGRQTVIYAPAATAGAYRAASDVTLSEDDFLDILFGEETDEAPAPAPMPASSLPANAGDRQASAAAAGTARLGPEAMRRLADALMSEIALSGHAPLPLAAAANTVRAILGPQADTYGGYGGFGALLNALPLRDVRIDYHLKTIVPLAAPDSPASPPPESQDEHPASPLDTLIRRIGGLTDVPPFSPALYEAVFDALPREIRDSGFGVGRTPRGLAGRILREHGATVPVRDLAFVMRTVAMPDERGQTYFFSAESSAEALAARLRDQVTWLCRRNGLALSAADRALLCHWIRAAGDARPALDLEALDQELLEGMPDGERQSDDASLPSTARPPGDGIDGPVAAAGETDEAPLPWPPVPNGEGGEAPRGGAADGAANWPLRALSAEADAGSA